ncbi:hypothetical protein VTJ04DRAFT_6824 [Mycothermus thermophilus]|uniref:uncharacterized protein n=1 Tax=Humicola insolens TaxID=85995 RepID=UPI0037428668
MRLPPDIFLLIAERLDAASIFTLMQTCKGIRQLFLTHERSIAKAWISRVLFPPISNLATDFLSSTDFYPPEDPTEVRQPCIIKQHTFKAIKELNLRGRRIDALFAAASPESPRGVGALRHELVNHPAFRNHSDNDIQHVIPWLKLTCRLADHLGDLAATIQPSTMPAFMRIFGFDKIFSSDDIQRMRVHAARCSFIANGGMSPAQLDLLSLLTDLGAMALHTANATLPGNHLHELFLRHGTAVVDALICDADATTANQGRLAEGLEKAHHELYKYYVVQDRHVSRELTAPASEANLFWDASDNLRNVLDKALRAGESKDEN